ncbi:MAG: pantothenate kinase [Waterburya sp.]
MENEYDWLALVAGNSRLHWGWFKHHSLIDTWDTPHLGNKVKPRQLPQLFFPANFIQQGLLDIPVYLASVVSQQTNCWQNYEQINLINLPDIKLINLYPTMGIDRALATWGAIATYHQACLVIDGGTALTFTGADQQGHLIGGAILPGLRSLLRNLNQTTSALPKVKLPDTLPPRWALDTDTAIASGILYTAIAGVHSYIVDWRAQFPDSKVIFTGGDGEILWRFLQQHLQEQLPELAPQITVDPNLIFQGIRLVHEQQEMLQNFGENF